MSTATASIVQAVTTVVASWETNRTQSPYTTEKYSSVLSRFVRFAEAHRIVVLAQVDAALVEAFVHSLGRDRRGRVSRVVSGRTRVNRLSALRAFYAAAISAGWVESNPTADIAVPSRGGTKPQPRPLTNSEADQVRYLAGVDPAHQRPVVVALLLSGAWATEISSLTTTSFDSDYTTLHLPGVRDRRARTITLEQDVTQIVTGRVSWLRSNTSGREAYLVSGPASPFQRQAKVFVVARSAITRAGLGNDAAVTPASLTLWAARRAFDSVGRIEAAARLVGFTSLDATANALGWDWAEDTG